MYSDVSGGLPFKMKTSLKLIAVKMYFVENLKKNQKLRKKLACWLNSEETLYFVSLNCIMVVKLYLKFYY